MPLLLLIPLIVLAAFTLWVVLLPFLMIGYALAYTLGLRARLWQDATDQHDSRR